MRDGDSQPAEWNLPFERQPSVPGNRSRWLPRLRLHRGRVLLIVDWLRAGGGGMKRLLVPITAAVLLVTLKLRAADAPARPMTARELLDRWEAALARTLTCSVHNELVAREQYPWRPKVTWRRQSQTCYRERDGRFHYFG